jgi:hypothetical protein
MENMNVLPLFDSILITPPAELEGLLHEGLRSNDPEAEMPEQVGQIKRLVATEAQFPDHSMVVLNRQLNSLEESLARLKFYLADLDDLLPR